MIKVKSLALLLIATLTVGCTPLKFADDQSCYQPSLPYYKEIKVALVLGGGGAKGMAHVGVLTELEAAGIKPDLIVGCSSGAIVGSLYADNPNAAVLKDALMEKRREHVMNLSVDFFPFGITDGEALKVLLESHLRSKTFYQLQIPFVAVATNLQFGQMVAFGSGPLTPAILASAAYPGVFTPVMIEGQYFVDGGVTNNVPVEVARQMGAQYIIAVELASDLPKKAPKHAVGILRRCLEISLAHQANIAMRDADFIIKVPMGHVGTFDDGKNQVVYDAGRLAGKLAINNLKQNLQSRFKPYRFSVGLKD